MTGLAQVLAVGPVPPVARLRSRRSVASVRAAAETAGWEFAALDGVRVANRQDFLCAAGEALSLPEDWGRNFDALADSLRDLPHRSGAAGTVLLWESWGRFAVHDAQWFEVALEVLGERAGRQDLPPLLVLLRGPGTDLALPVIDA